MIQVYLLDENNFFTGESKFVEEVKEGMTTVPYLVGYIKGKLVDGAWIEGATEEEIKAFYDAQPVPPEPVKTVAELETEIEALNATIAFHEDLMAEMAMKLYA